MTAPSRIIATRLASGKPKVAWVTPVANQADIDRTTQRASADRIGEADVLLVGEASLGGEDSVPTPASFDAVANATSAPYLVFAHPDASFSTNLVSRAVERLDQDTRHSHVRCRYTVGGDSYLVPEDLSAIDASLGHGDLPLFAVVRRSAAATETWDAIQTKLGLDHFVSASVDVSRVSTGSRGPRQIAARAVRMRRNLAAKVRQAADRVAEVTSGEPPLDVAYIGLAGHANLGDDAMYEAVRHLLPWANLRVNPSDAQAVVLGGGTLINADGYYLNRIRRVDAPAIPSLVFGTGVRHLEFFGTTELYERWGGFLRRAEPVGVRGPDSLAALRSFGYDGVIEIIGDPALSLEVPTTATTVNGHVIVAPLHTGGALHGGDDAAVLETLSATVARLRGEGHPVTLLSCHPRDDRWALEMLRRIGDLDVDYLAGYDSVANTLAAIASAELVIGERLHASVLAAAAGTPFVAVEYRPKVLDFAKSVDQEDAVVRTDALGRLDDVVSDVWASRQARSGVIAEHVATFRTRQRTRAATFKEAVAESATPSGHLAE